VHAASKRADSPVRGSPLAGHCCEHRSRAIILIGCWKSYAAGGARLGPRARGASPSGSTLSRAGSVSAIFAIATRASLNKGSGAFACRSSRAVWKPGAWRR